MSELDTRHSWLRLFISLLIAVICDVGMWAIDRRCVEMVSKAARHRGRHRGQWQLFIRPIWPSLLTGVLRTLEWHWMEFSKHCDRRIYIVARPATAKIGSNTDVIPT